MLEELRDRSWVRVGQELDGYRKTLRTHRTSTGLHVWEVTGVQHVGCSKRPSSRAAGEREPEAYPLGYVEPLSAARTPLADFFSILLERRSMPC